MNNSWEAVIGIEIHVQLNTKSKMFSSSHNNFNDQANTNISIFDVGYPGAMPTVNKGAVIKAIKLAKALKMTIDHELHFDRKHYFYPDLPRGFQITQQLRPIAINGTLDVGASQIAIARIQLEEDTAKSLHNNFETKLDYNRSGVPLIEIITAPVIRSAQQARDYVATIRQLVRFLNISDAKMEEGSLRADLNVSVRKLNSLQFGTKVEIKNINSINNLFKAAQLEIDFQIKQLEANQTINQVTKHYDDKTNQNVVMRSKEETLDYKYFPEPNIPPLQITKALIASVTLPKLPAAITRQFKQLGFANSIVDQLLNDPRKLAFIKAVGHVDIAKVTKVFFSEIMMLANKQKKDFMTLEILPQEIKYVLAQVANENISNAQLKQIIPLLQGQKQAAQIIKEHHFEQITNPAAIVAMLDTIIATNEPFIHKNITRPDRVQKFLIGQLMKASRGQVNPVRASTIVARKLAAIAQTK